MDCSQPGKKLVRPHLNQQLDVLAHARHFSYTRRINKRMEVQVVPDKNMRPYSKKNQSKKGWEVAQAVQLLSTKYKALRSTPSASKKKKKLSFGSLFLSLQYFSCCSLCSCLLLFYFSSYDFIFYPTRAT
jgi:hypothetical protein